MLQRAGRQPLEHKCCNVPVDSHWRLEQNYVFRCTDIREPYNHLTDSRQHLYRILSKSEKKENSIKTILLVLCKLWL